MKQDKTCFFTQRNPRQKFKNSQLFQCLWTPIQKCLRSKIFQNARFANTGASKVGITLPEPGSWLVFLCIWPTLQIPGITDTCSIGHVFGDPNSDTPTHTYTKQHFTHRTVSPALQNGNSSTTLSTHYKYCQR